MLSFNLNLPKPSIGSPGDSKKQQKQETPQTHKPHVCCDSFYWWYAINRLHWRTSWFGKGSAAHTTLRLDNWPGKTLGPTSLTSKGLKYILVWSYMEQFFKAWNALLTPGPPWDKKEGQAFDEVIESAYIWVYFWTICQSTGTCKKAVVESSQQ